MSKRLVTLLLLYALTMLTTTMPAGPALAGPNSNPPTRLDNKPACPTCAGRSPGQTVADKIDSLAIAGRRAQATPLVPIQASIFDGSTANFVSTSTGHLAFAVTDLAILGPMPTIFQRVYSSARQTDSGLGIGWSFVFDDRIDIEGNMATMNCGDGRTLIFNSDGSGRNFDLKTPEPGMHQSFQVTDQKTIIERTMGSTRTYQKLVGSYRLSQIANSNGDQIAMDFDSRGNLVRIAGSGGSLKLQWSDRKDARLLSVGDSAGRRVVFKQDGQRLREVVDVADTQWSYDYLNERLSRATDPLGRTLLRVRYDRSGRAVEVGDAAGSYHYDYDSGPVSERSVVTDPLGVKTIFEHNGLGETVSVGEEGEPKLLRIDYNAAHRPSRLSGPFNGETNFVFDAQNRLVQSASSDGSTEGYAFDEAGQISSFTKDGVQTEYSRNSRGLLTAARSSDPNLNYRATYNSRGQLESVESNNGRKVTNEYDAAGRTTAFNVNGIGVFQTEFDNTGRVSLERVPSGMTFRYERDARGSVTRKSDSTGLSASVEREANGSLKRVVNPDGSWIRATRDQTGRIVALNTSAGNSRHFAYDSRGGLTDYTDGFGRHKRFAYDRHGRLNRIDDDNGNRTVVDRDQNGSIQRISVLTGGGWQYDYDRNGRLVTTRGPRDGLKSGATFLATAFSRAASWPSLTVPAPQGVDCMFGYDPVYDASVHGLGDCSDPFGGFDGGFGCDGSMGFDDEFGLDFDPYGGGCGPLTQETPEQCAARQQRICRKQWNACRVTVIGVYVAASVVCAGVLIFSPLAGALCLIGATTKYVMDMIACDLKYQSCQLQIPDKCRP